MNIDNCQKITQNFFSLGENNYPTLNSPESMREFFDREGYIVVRNAVAKELCAEAIQAFNLQVKPDTKTFFIRHESGTGERHIFTEAGFMKYPIMNIQDLGSRYQQFRETGLGILTQDTVKKVIATILGEPGKLIHTMYFDGNQHTCPHRDTYTIDSEQIGTMIGVWVAAEDIQLGAGSFYVYPKSHRMVMPLEATGEEINPNGKDYKDGVRTTLTFAATANPITYLGAKPVFIDSDRISSNMNPDLLQEALQKRAYLGKLPKAFVVVHLYGQSADIEPIIQACNQYDIPQLQESSISLEKYWTILKVNIR